MQRTARLRALLAAVAATHTVRASADFFQGQGTTYTLSEPNNGNCNFMAYPGTALTKYAALNEKQWDATMNCGRCAEVTCTDARCKGNGGSEIVHIVDQCPGCEYGDLDLAPTVFETITGFTSDRLQIQWRFVDCPITSNIKYCLKKGSNAFWTAIQPTNFVAGIASLKVNDRETTMVDSAYYFLLDGKSESKTDLSNLKITITAVNGQVTEDTVSFADSDCIEGKSQIKAGNPTSPKDQEQSQASSAATHSSASASTAQQQTPSPTPSATPVPSPEPSPVPPTVAPSPMPSPIAVNATTEVAGGQEAGVLQAPSAVPVPADAAVVATPSPPQQSSSGPQVVEQIKVEAAGSSNTTSPAILILTASGCVAGVALIVLAVYAKRKQAADKRDDRLEGSITFESNLLNLVPEDSVTLESSLVHLVAAHRGRSRVSSLSMSSFHALQSPARVEPNVAPL